MQPHRDGLARPLSGWVEFASVTAVALATMALVLAFTNRRTYDHPRFDEPGDHLAYYEMAAGEPFSYTRPPYSWRIAILLLARTLPLDIASSFLAISFISLAATAVAIYYLARAFGHARPMALLGMLLFLSMGWATKYGIFNFWLVDASSFLIITAAIYAIVTRKDAAYVALLAVGVTVKESVLFVAPLYYTLRADRLLDWRLGVRALLLAVPALAVLVALRVGIPPTTRYNYVDRFGEFVRLRADRFGWIQLQNWTVGTFGFATLLLPFFAPRRNAELLLRFLPFLLLVGLQLLLARDNSRLLVLGFPAVILLALNGASALAARARIGIAWLLAIPLATLMLTLGVAAHFAPLTAQAPIAVLFLGPVIWRLWTLTAGSEHGGIGGSLGTGAPRAPAPAGAGDETPPRT